MRLEPEERSHLLDQMFENISDTLLEEEKSNKFKALWDVEQLYAGEVITGGLIFWTLVLLFLGTSSMTMTGLVPGEVAGQWSWTYDIFKS